MHSIAPRGFEPRLPEPKSGVLPLDDGAVSALNVHQAGGKRNYQVVANDTAVPARRDTIIWASSRSAEER